MIVTIQPPLILSIFGLLERSPGTVSVRHIVLYGFVQNISLAMAKEFFEFCERHGRKHE